LVGFTQRTGLPLLLLPAVRHFLRGRDAGILVKSSRAARCPHHELDGQGADHGAGVEPLKPSARRRTALPHPWVSTCTVVSVGSRGRTGRRRSPRRICRQGRRPPLFEHLQHPTGRRSLAATTAVKGGRLKAAWPLRHRRNRESQFSRSSGRTAMPCSSRAVR